MHESCGSRRRALLPAAGAAHGEIAMAKVEKWECRVCLHLHEGEEPPENCPVCGAPASEFLPVED
jgi:rubrerythrin